MDDKMKAAFDAWFQDRYAAKDRPTSSECAEWATGYLRSQQEPVGIVTYTGYEPEFRFEWLNGNSPDRLGDGANLYAHPIPSAPVPDGFCLDEAHRWHKETTGEVCTCPKYVRHPECTRHETRKGLLEENPWLAHTH